MTQPKHRRDLILHRPERALAEEFGLELEEVQAILDAHPIELDREKYLRRALAQQLLLLDRLEVTFGRMAFDDRDTAAGRREKGDFARLERASRPQRAHRPASAPAPRNVDRSHRTRA